MQLTDLFPQADLDHALAERLVVARRHPTAPLTILNYTERCQYEPGLWSPLTLQCRGLIYSDDGTVVARPFRKFFNHDQAGAPQLALDAPVFVTDKLDGSLGILYPTLTGWAISTRGSFESEQAIHATTHFWMKYPGFTPPDGWTMCFEIVYPQNRIVLDYGPMDELILLGAVEIATGKTVGPYDDILRAWPGLRAMNFSCTTLAEALALPPRPNAEGIVIHFTDTDERVKIKQDDYVALHKIICGLNERTIWDYLSTGKPLVELLNSLPDEFHDWVGTVATRLSYTVASRKRDVLSVFSKVTATLPENFTRKDFALAVQGHVLAAYLFKHLDGKDYSPMIWKDMRPSARVGPRGIAPSEETA